MLVLPFPYTLILMKILLKSLGFVFANLPECVMNALCRSVGWLIYIFPTRRINVAFSNVYHCFPGMSRNERKKIVLESCCRMVEMALFVISSPYIPKERLKENVSISEEVLEELKKNYKNPRPTVLMIPHFAMMETITMFPMLVDIPIPPTGVFYRPFDNKALEDWIKESRERCGVELVSRKGGVLGAINFLKKNGILAVLFDQNAGGSGAVSLFFDRVCSTSELPGIFVERQNADCAVFYARRIGFWRSKIFCQRLDCKTIEDVTIAGNDWLEEKLKTDEIARYDWLWLHRRWRINHENSRQLSIPKAKSILEYTLKKKNLREVPRKTSIYITAPDSLSDCISLMPILRQIRKSRFDAAITLICDYKFTEILSLIGMGKAFDFVISAPSRNRGMFSRILFYRNLKEHYPDIHLVLSDCIQADCEAFALAANRTFSIQTSRRRLFMDGVYKPDAAQSGEHISLEFEKFARSFGMKGEISYLPFKNDALSLKKSETVKVAVVCGGAGEHAWSAGNWSKLISILNEQLPDAKFLVYGNGDDTRTAFEIAKITEDADIKNCASLGGADIVRGICACDIVVGADSPLLHVANALGVKTAALYGNANPIRRGMVFDADKVEIQPQNCPPQGGADVNKIRPEDAARDILKLLLKL